MEKDQHFMVNRKILGKIAEAGKIKPNETILEIGGGEGALTELLSRRGKLIVIEIDSKLAYSLKKRFPGARIVKGNALNLIGGIGFDKIVSNLPYSICEPLLHKLVLKKFSLGILTVPEKFFLRITQGRTKLSFLSRSSFIIEKLFDIPKGAFAPEPKVKSVVISITPRESVLKFLFLSKKKKLKNALREYIISRQKTTKKLANESIKSLKINNNLLEKQINELRAIDFDEIESKTKSL